MKLTFDINNCFWSGNTEMILLFMIIRSIDKNNIIYGDLSETKIYLY